MLLPLVSSHAWQQARARGANPMRVFHTLQRPDIIELLRRYAPLRVALTGLLPSGTTLIARYNAVTERPEAITVLSPGMSVNPWTLKVQVAA